MMKITPILVCLICLIPVSGHAAKIYKWRGPDGQIHYSSTPPPEVNAQSTGKNTTTRQNTPSDSDDIGEQDDEKSMTDKERIRTLEERIKRLEEERLGDEKAGNAELRGEDGEEKISEQDNKPDYSIQGQARMLEEEKRIRKLKVRCRAKAPHGVDCNNPESYEQY